jgi:hypothetical protein
MTVAEAAPDQLNAKACDRQLTDIQIKRAHRRARKAPISDWCTLGAEQGREDALACFVGMSSHDAATVHALQRQRMADRVRRFSEAGISEDRVAAYLDSHTAAFANHFGEVVRRGQPRVTYQFEPGRQS